MLVRIGLSLDEIDSLDQFERAEFLAITPVLAKKEMSSVGGR